MIINNNISSQKAINLAKTGSAAIAATKNNSMGRSTRLVGDTFLNAVTEKGTPSEKELAGAVQSAVKEVSFNCDAINVQKIALEAIAAGISGPMSVVFATIGEQAMAKIDRREDKSAVARSMLSGAEANLPEGKEKVLADTILATTSKRMFDNTKNRIYKIAFDAVNGNKSMQAAMKEPTEVMLAKTGSHAISIADSSDRENVAAGFLEGIMNHTGDSEVKTFTNVVDEIAQLTKMNEFQISVREDALNIIGQEMKGDAATNLAVIGKRLTKLVGGSSNLSQSIGSVLLERIAKHSNNGDIRDIAETALLASKNVNTYVAEGVQKVAFENISMGKDYCLETSMEKSVKNLLSSFKSSYSYRTESGGACTVGLTGSGSCTAG